MSSSRKDHLGASSSEPLPVIIVGNGPSGICLSYLLSGYTPYVKPDAVHPHPLLQRKLTEAPGVSILDQDLDYLSEGLEGRSQSPVALLFDALLRPDTDFGGNMKSVLTWKHQEEHAIPHVVLGRNLPGGAWHVSGQRGHALWGGLSPSFSPLGAGTLASPFPHSPPHNPASPSSLHPAPTKASHAL
uniref:Oxidative stress induced growth inhibitor 1 n=1 Tax=Macaca fascicularis TaxID=9541 RepID=A0A2K5X798_MACFA